MDRSTAEAAPRLRMATMGAQRPQAPASAAARRARFFNSANAFNIKLPVVPSASFSDAPRQALARHAATGYWACDQSAALGGNGPATTPLMLARYAHIAAGETLSASFEASGSIWYVIAGSGNSDCALGMQSEHVSWGAGDVMLFPGAGDLIHSAGPEGATLWMVSDEPLLALDGLRSLPASVESVVHYPAAEIARQMALVTAAEPEADTSGRALIFSTEALQGTHNLHPVMTLSLNSLAPCESQPAHRHNSAAITLVVDGEDCHSMVDGEVIAWEQWSTMVTPPGAVHSHHNGGGARRALFLIVQDGGLYYRARTMGFESRASAAD